MCCLCLRIPKLLSAERIRYAVRYNTERKLNDQAIKDIYGNRIRYRPSLYNDKDSNESEICLMIDIAWW